MGLLRLIFARTMRIQSILGVALLAVVGVTVVGLDLLARNDGLAAWLEHREAAFCRKAKISFWNAGYFADAEDRLLNEELPAADYSKGGVYLMGASNVRAAAGFWDLPIPQRRLIHNYAISRSSHTDKFQFVRYLTEHDGWLRAGGEKTLLILGVSYGEVIFKHDPEGYFEKLWERHGLYAYDPDQGIIPLTMNPARRFLHFERVRIAGCLTKLKYFLIEEARLYKGVKHVNWREINSHEEPQPSLSEREWEVDLRDQLSEFRNMLDYITARNVHVAVVMLPYGSWEEKSDFTRTYAAEMSEICKSRGIQLCDWGRLLEDDDFDDSCHPNIFGADKLQSAFLGIALPFLRSTGVLGD
jgi:hypothetical protein